MKQELENAGRVRKEGQRAFQGQEQHVQHHRDKARVLGPSKGYRKGKAGEEAGAVEAGGP